MINRSILLSFTMALLSIGSALAGESDQALYQRSDLWPPRIELVQAVKAEGTNGPIDLKSGRTGILIRLEWKSDALMALVDFGRQGLVSVPLNRTDIATRAEAIREGSRTKAYANWTMMLGRGLVDPTTNGGKVPLKSLKEFNRFLIVYIKKDEVDLPAVGEFLDSINPVAENEGVLPLIIPVGYGSNHNELAQLLRESGIESPFMLNFLAKGYVNVLGHDPGPFPYFVLVDTNGKTLLKDRLNEGKDDAAKQLIKGTSENLP